LLEMGINPDSENFGSDVE